MIYQPGQRVELVHTSDPHTRLRPGDRGTVIGHHTATDTVDITWDDGSRLSMCPDTGDRIRLLDQPEPLNQLGATDQRWAHLLGLVRDRAGRAGRAAADRWARQALSADDIRATARRVLADVWHSVGDGDLTVLGASPPTGAPDARVPVDGRRYLELVVGDTPAWRSLTAAQRDELAEVFHDSLRTAVEDRVAQHCHLVLGPTGDGHPGT